MEPQDQKSNSPEQKVAPDIDVKPEPETIGEQQQHQQQQHPSSVIMRRQVITTAGTIEDETKIENPSPEEQIMKTSEGSVEGSPQNGTPVQYQEGGEEQTRAAFEPDRFTVATTEAYNNNQNEYQNVSDNMQYTLEIHGQPHNIPIAGTHYETVEDTKSQIIYTNLESVSSPYAGNQHYSVTDTGTYMPHQYQNYQPQYTSRSPDDSPPSNLVHRNDPTLASSRLYSTVSFLLLLVSIYSPKTAKKHFHQEKSPEV